FLHEIALTLTHGIGGVTARTLLSHFGDAETLFKAKKSQLTSIPGVGVKTAESILKKEAFPRAEKELQFIERYKIKVLSYLSDEYPRRLKNCYDAPLILYYKG